VKRLIALAVSMSSAVAVTIPVVASATHKAGHGTGGQELTIGAQPNPIVAGQRTAVSGRLKGPNHAGKTVTLQGAPHPFTSFNNNVATTTTNSGGNYSFRRPPRLHTRYRVKVGSLLSPTVTVNVRRRVSLYLTDYTPLRGSLVRFSGRACPQGDGLVVSIQRLRSDGTWKTLRWTHLREASRCSVYSRRIRIFNDHTFRTVIARDDDHFRGFSRRRVADAHR
jgi:hypothetical protein